MKKILFIFLFFLCQNVFCQEYYFDRFYEYTSNDKGVCFFLLNTKDDNYLFFGRSYKNEITGFIFDYKTIEYHYYNVINNKNGVVFNYENSRKIRGTYPESDNIKALFDYTITKIDSLKESVKIIKYKEKRKRKNLAELELIYDENNMDYIFHNSALLFFSP